MATAHATMSYPPFGTTQAVDAVDMMDSFLDFNGIQSPGPSSRPASRLPASQHPDSTLTSPATTIVPLEEDFQSAKPSHDYGLFKQQTGIPSGTLGLNASNPSYNYNGFNSGIPMDFIGENYDGMTEMSNMDVDFTSASNNTGLPAFFFPGNAGSQSEDFVDPSSISPQEEVQANVRFFPGMHKQKAQQAALAKAQEQARQMQRHQMLHAAQHQQQQQQQKPQQQQQQQQQNSQHSRSQSNGKRGSAGQSDARVEEIIGRVVNQIRQNSHLPGQNMNSPLPHIGRIKKDEEDMDDDERLLASEEGKKLSSKERRQLRNKVSARAFRSRRKEYIGQLESEVAGKAAECNDLRIQNHALLEENARSRAFIEKLLRHPAFNPFLDDLSRDPSIMESLPKLTPPVPSQTLASSSSQDFNTPVSAEPNSQALQVGMTMIPETPMDMGMLGVANNNWSNIAIPGFNGFQHNPQIFAVLELPEEPAMPDFAAMSGKGESFTSQFSGSNDAKADYPVIERPESMPQQETTAVAPTFENPEDFALYADAPATPASVLASAPLLENLSLPSKASVHFELIVVSSADDEAQLMNRLERMCASIDSSFERVKTLTDAFQL